MGKNFACADIHGCYDVLMRMLEYCNYDDKIYFLGDAIDRENHGIKCVDALLADKRVRYLCGNHEQLAANAIPYIFNENLWDRNDAAIDQWYMNGGMKTIEELSECDNPLKYAGIFNKLPKQISIINNNGQTIMMEHAGFTPADIPHRNHDPLWDREHFFDPWRNKSMKNIYLIHGHTPVHYLKFHYGYLDAPKLTEEEMEVKHRLWKAEDVSDWRPSVIRYCSGHKFDIDLGVFFSGVAALLDLDTFEPLYFNKDGIING